MTNDSHVSDAEAPQATAPTSHFDTAPQRSLNLQMVHDLLVAQAEHGPEINDRVRPRAA